MKYPLFIFQPFSEDLFLEANRFFSPEESQKFQKKENPKMSMVAHYLLEKEIQNLKSKPETKTQGSEVGASLRRAV